MFPFISCLVIDPDPAWGYCGPPPNCTTTDVTSNQFKHCASIGQIKNLHQALKDCKKNAIDIDNNKVHSLEPSQGLLAEQLINIQWKIIKIAFLSPKSKHSIVISPPPLLRDLSLR